MSHSSIVSAAAFFFLTILLIQSCKTDPQQFDPLQPNILWLTSEDMNPMLGCYGDSQARTPNLDQLARTGLRYTNAFAVAPVCSPSRSTLITGVYATSLGTQHLRSTVEKPDFIKGFPEYLRAAGYYCSNNYKEDYNFSGKHFWDESSQNAHWRKRKPGQPFFSVFNFNTTHQSQIFGSDEAFYEKYGKQLTEQERQSPKDVPLPPYYPDTPPIRKLVARYYDLVTIMDRQAGELLKQLEEDGLSDNTIVFYYSDHGTGMPRGKRSLYDSGLQVPLIIHFPEKLQEHYGIKGSEVIDRVVSFVDFAPTVLSLLNLDIPEYMQGTPFLGKAAEKIPAPAFVFGTSDRVDEAYEFSRSVRSEKYLYIRNYLPQLPLIQPNFYTDQSEIMQELIAARATGGLNVQQELFWEPRRMMEELYDVTADPHQIKNLIYNPTLEPIVQQMRQAHQDWMRRTHDTGMMPETYMYRIANGNKPFESAQDSLLVPIDDFLHIAEAGRIGDFSSLQSYLKHQNPMLQYWAINSLEYYGRESNVSTNELQRLIETSEAPEVQLAALKLLCQVGDCEQQLSVLPEFIKGSNEKAMLMAARTYQLLAKDAQPIAAAIQQIYAGMRDFDQDRKNWNDFYKLYTYWSLKESGLQ